jgi:dsRNA-specific ribonuclease
MLRSSVATMDALKWRSCIIKQSLKYTLASGIFAQASGINKSDEDSLDDLSFGSQEDSVLCATSNNNNEPSASSDTDASVRCILDFLEPFLREKDKLQPTAILQQHYATFQHKRDKKSKQVSVKPWFSYTQLQDECKDLWWTAKMSVPEEVAVDWGLETYFTSGHLPLLLDEGEVVKAGVGYQDLLSALFGKFKIQSDGEKAALLFKSKAAAQKSATLNLLSRLHKSLKIEAHEAKSNSNRAEHVHPTETQFPSWVNRLHVLGFGGQEARYTLYSIKHQAALSDPKGPMLSANNPCVIKCILTCKDNSSGDQMSIKSGDHFTKEHSFEDMLRCLEASLSTSNVLCQSSVVETHEKELIMGKYDQSVSYEKTLPLWSTAPVESTAFLYELKFTTNNTTLTASSEISSSRNSKIVPFCHVYGLEESESTRIGLLTGSDIFDVLNDGQTELSAEFTIPSSEVPYGNVSVTVCNRTRIDLSELKSQMPIATELDPVSLIKCFNATLFENGGRTYGITPAKSQAEILSQICDNRSDSDRTYLLLPLEPSESINDRGLLIDWRTIIDVVNDTSTPALAITDGNEPHLISNSTLHNRFIKQPVGFKGNLFVMDRDSNSALTAESLLPQDMISDIPHETKAKFYDRYGLDMESATYASYHTCCWAKKPGQDDLEMSVLKYPHQSLIKAHKVLSHIDSDFTISLAKVNSASSNKLPRSVAQRSIAELLITAGYLIPELAVCLPMPRDMLYLAQHSCHFMTALERSYDLKAANVRLLTMQREAGNALQEHANSSSASLTKLINDATELNNRSLVRENERLESLGDAVLMFLVTMNVFSSCSHRRDDVLDLFNDEITKQGKNKVLSVGAMLIGLSRLSHDKANAISSWRSACMPNATAPSDGKPSVKVLADTMESIIGATFLVDRTGAMSVSILNEIAPCFDASEGQLSTKHWFTAVSTCMHGAYQFERDALWTLELNRLNGILKESSVL